MVTAGHRGFVSEELPAPKSKPRLTSLDAFRGLTIIGMLIVNNVALDELTPKTLTHAEWSGAVHLADVVFPWFLFAVGIALPFSFASHLRKGLSVGKFIGKAAVRALILIALGIAVDSSVQREFTPGLGVLQFIGLSFLFGALMIALPKWGRLALSFGAIIAQYSIIRHLPFPGSPTGTFAEEANALKFLNDTYLEPWHLRGLLSVLTTGPLVAIASVFGETLLRETPRRWLVFAGGGVAMVAMGLLSQAVLPMNKPLWTGSYVLYCGGLGVLALVVLHALFDTESRAKWAMPLVVFGSNAILAYVGPILVKTLLLRSIPSEGGNLETALQLWSKQWLGPLGGGIFYTATYIVVWWLVLFVLYRKRIFIRV